MPVTSGSLLASLSLLLWKMIMEVYLPQRVYACRWLWSCTPQVCQEQNPCTWWLWEHFVPEFLQFKWRKNWYFRIFFPKWKVPGAQRLTRNRLWPWVRTGKREQHPQVLPCCPCAASALASQSCMWRLPSSQLDFGVLDVQQNQSLRSWDAYTFLLGGQSESNAGGGLEPLKISR